MKTPRLFAAVMLTTATTYAANLIQNGSYESPVVPSTVLAPDVPVPWQKSGDEAYMIRGRYGSAQEGQQYIGIKNGSSLSQTFVIRSTGSYVLTWFDSTEFNGPDQLSPYTVSVRDSANSLVGSVSFDANNVSGVGVWRPRSIQFGLSPGSYTLTFLGQSGSVAEPSLIDNVSLPGSVNNPPVADDQSVTTGENTPVSIILTASDPEGDALTYQVLTSPTHGTLTGTPPELLYTPDPCFSGNDSFTFKANDGTDDSQIATVSIAINACVESGPLLMAQFPEKTSIDDLSEPFRSNVLRFKAALEHATDMNRRPNHVNIDVSETYRSPERAYLMWAAYGIAHSELQLATVPEPDEETPIVTGLPCIKWIHTDSDCNPDPDASIRAVKQMLRVAARHGIAHRPSYPSNHQYGTAIDMTITWDGTLRVVDANGRIVTMIGARNGGSNRQLWQVGATYGVIKLRTDGPHWSLDGH